MVDIEMKKLITVLVVLFLGFLGWELLLPHRYECSGPMTVDNALKKCPIDLPASASNVYVATYRHWQAYADHVRFEAPLEDCRSHATTLVGGNKQAVPITPDNPSRWNFLGFKNGLSWFDIQSITNGSFAGGGPSERGYWIDTDRQIFYYCETD